MSAHLASRGDGRLCVDIVMLTCGLRAALGDSCLTLLDGSNVRLGNDPHGLAN